MLDELAAAGFVVRFNVDGEEYGYIPTWHRHQRVNIRERASQIPAPPNERAQRDEGELTSGGKKAECPHVHASGEVELERELEGKGNEPKGEPTRKRKNRHEPSEEQPSIYRRTLNLDFKSEDFDHEAFVEEIRKLYVRGCDSPAGWNACCEAIETEMKENPGWKRQQAAAFILERTAVVSDLMRSQPADQHAFWPTLLRFMTDRQYRDSFSTFERKSGNQQFQQQRETRAELEERRSHEAINKAARNLVARHGTIEADGVDESNRDPAADH